MSSDVAAALPLDLYASLLLEVGVNLQPGQSLNIRADLELAEVARALAGAAYRRGAPYVHIEWLDALSLRERFAHSRPEHLGRMPEAIAAFTRERTDEGWAHIHIEGHAHPDAFDGIDPAVMAREREARMQKIARYREAMMAFRFPWTIAAYPTPAWARQVFPDAEPAAALDRLGAEIAAAMRLDQPDPIEAWQRHVASLKQAARALNADPIRSLHFFDPAPGRDGRPATDLHVGLTDAPHWLSACVTAGTGVDMVLNIPSEELFTTPHRARVEGHARATKPALPFDRRVEDAWFRFEGGEVVDFDAAVGRDTLEQLFALRGARALGEVALVDVRSPINQAGIIFQDVLFDENCASHIAFGTAYAAGVVGGQEKSAEERLAAGINEADAHEDFMIGSPTMQVTAELAGGGTRVLMRDGKFTSNVVSE